MSTKQVQTKIAASKPAPKLSAKQNAVQFFKFLGFSLGAGIIQFSTFALLFEVCHLVEWASHLIALTLSVLFNFTLNRKFTFRSANNVYLAMFLIAMFYVVFTPLSTWFVDEVSKYVYPLLVELMIMVLNFVLEFLYCRFFVYRKSINTNQRKIATAKSVDTKPPAVD